MQSSPQLAVRTYTNIIESKPSFDISHDTSVLRYKFER